MFFILSKLISFLFTPLSWVIVLFIISIIWKKRKRGFRIASIIVFFIFSSPLLVKVVSNSWEVPMTLDDDIPKTKVGVVLGGYAAYDTSIERISFRFGGDRIAHGLRVLGLDKIDHLILSGGSGFVTRPDLKESIYVAEYLDQIGMPKRKFWIESESKNTYENAVYTKALLEEKGLLNEPIILITSGYHMPRSIACFKKQGLNVIPYSVDSMTIEDYSLNDIIPNAQALSYWNVLIHEWVGYLSYWVMGYL